MASRSELVINLKDPYIDVEIIDNQSSKSNLELVSILDIVGRHRDRNVTELENSLCTALGRVDDILGCLIWLTTHDRNAELNTEFDLIIADFTWNDICLLAFDKITDLLEGLRRVKHSLRQAQMFVEANIVFWDYKVEPSVRMLDFDQLKDLHIVFVNFTSHREWRYVDHIDIRIFASKDAHNLRVFFLLQLFNGHA